MLLLIFWSEYVANVGGNNEHVIGGEWVIIAIDVWHNMTSPHPTSITIGGTYGECKVVEPLD